MKILSLPAAVGCFLVSAITFLLTSCYETKQEFTLNPDGSGKVVHECSFQNINLNISNQDDDDPQEALQSAIAAIIKNSEGVEAWRDVTFKNLDDGRIWFRGTAYFKNLEELTIQNQSMLDFTWKPGPGGKAELTLNLKKSDDPAPDAPAKELTGAEREKKIKEERAKFQQSKPMLAAMLGGLTQTATFHLPGKVESSSNFKTGPGGKLGIAFDGSKMISALETLMADDEWLMKNGFDAQQPPDMDSELGKVLFGEKAPVTATVSAASKPLFDYAAEVAEALKQADQLQKQLGGVSVAPPAAGGDLKSIKVVGVRMVEPLPKKLDLRPFSQEAGFTLSVLAEFPGSVLDVTDKSALTSATASDGSSLLKGDSDWDRRLGFPKLSADKATVLFDVDLASPPAGATGFKEIAGKLEYRVANASREVKLGLKSLKAGEKGAELSALIEEIKDGWQNDGSQELELKVKIGLDDLKAAFLVVDGTRRELERSGYSGFSGSTTFTFSSKKPFPEKADIILEIHDDIKTFEVPFRLENLTLMGKPANP